MSTLEKLAALVLQFGFQKRKVDRQQVVDWTSAKGWSVFFYHAEYVGSLMISGRPHRFDVVRRYVVPKA